MFYLIRIYLIAVCLTVLVVSFAIAQKPDGSDLFVVIVDDKRGFIDQTGKIVIEPEWAGANEFSEGRAQVTIEGDIYKIGFIDSLGKMIIPAEFDAAGDFYEGLVAVGVGRFGVHGEGDHKFGYVDYDGKIIIEKRFSEAKAFSGGLAAVANEKGKWGYVNRTGELVIEHRFDDAFGFSEGLACVLKDGLFGFIDPNGKFAIEPKYLLPSTFKEGLAAVKTGQLGQKPYKSYGAYIASDGLFQFIDKKGATVFTLSGSVKRVNPYSEGLALVGIETQRGFPYYGYIDKKGEFVIKPIYFGFARDFSEGLAMVSVNDKHGFIDKTGKLIIRPAYSYGDNFKNGLARMEIGRSAADLKARAVYITKTGRLVWTDAKRPKKIKRS